MAFRRPEHNLIADLLRQMNHQMLMDNKCWFGGGTAIVLKFGEYRRSLDLDFLCASSDGYRELRNAFFDKGLAAVFPNSVRSLRDIKADAYGIRTLVEFAGQPLKLEIVREARIELGGEFDEELQAPLLNIIDMFAEKLLANADRGMDRSVAYRDAFDLGMLIKTLDAIPDVSLQKAIKAYGPDVERKAVWVVNRLSDQRELREMAEAVLMNGETAITAIACLRDECRRIWPDAKIK